MNLLSKIGTKASIVAGRTGLKLQKHSPEIFFAFGVVTFVGTVMTASKATLAIQDILEEQNKNLEAVKEHCELNPDSDYALNKAEKDRLICYSRMAVGVVKAYAPAIGFGVVSVGCFLTSKNIVQKRYLAAVCAYESVSEAFRSYRDRVVSESGEEMDRHYRYGTELVKETETIVDENGKKKKVEKTTEEHITIDKPGSGAVFFDESNPNWDQNNGFNLSFLRAQEDMATNILQSRGHIFLNEVYRMLGLPHTPEGALLGWVKGLGDDYVDFGLYKSTPGTRAFINGRENIVLLDFNHDGVMYNKI